MATLYCDFENGNDNYAGSSFALLAQGTNGRITSTTFSSIGANFPNDGSLIGQYLSIFNGSIYAVYNVTAWVSSTSLTIAALSDGTVLANQTVDRQYYIGGRWKNLTTGALALRTIPGDTVRIMGSPEPTSLGQNGVWTSQALQGTKSIVSSTNATPIAITCTAHGYSTGDTVVITGHTANTNANGTWEITSTGANTFTLDGSVGNGVGGATGTVRLRNNTRVMLTTAVTQNIASTGRGRTAWVASANVTTSISTTAQKEGAFSETISIAAAFTRGKAAYWTLPSVTNLSEYQQVSFWIRSDLISTIAAGVHELRLCSDTTGNVSVNTISIPAMNATSRWMPFTVDLGTNLGSNIQSIALYVVTDTGAQTLLLNNIIACKASSAPDSLTLTSLIGKNTPGETFWGIQSINGRRVMLDADTNATPISTTVRGYYGTSETVTTWKRETIKLGPAASTSTPLQTIQEGGTDGSPITYSGGWDRTNMSTQTLETWLDGQNGNGIPFNGNTTAWIAMEKFAGCRFSTVLPINITLSVIDFIAVCNNTNSAIDISGSGTYNCTYRIWSTHSNSGTNTLNFANGATNTFEFGIIYSNGSTSAAITSRGKSIVSLKTLPSGGKLANNAGSAYDCVEVVARFLTFEATAGVAPVVISDNFNRYLVNCILDTTTEVLHSLVGADAIVYSQNHDNTSGNHKIFMRSALISAATDQRKTASGFSWKIQPSSSVRSSIYPVTLSLAKVAVSANNLVTIKAWMRRDNAGLTMRLVCKGGQIAGVTNDVVSSLSTTDAWEELTITFTPTEVGVVEIIAEAWGGTTFSGWVDDLTISQV